MNPDFINQQFSETTLEPKAVLAILTNVPRYSLAGWAENASDHAQELLSYLEWFEWHLRRYLAGQFTTRHWLNETIRQFQKFDKRAADIIILFSLKGLHDQLLNEEIYELIPSLERTRKYIIKKFNIQDKQPQQ